MPWRVEKKNNEDAFERVQTLPGQELSVRYEHLRKMIGHSRERELFIQQGLVAWMGSWARYPREPVTSATVVCTQERCTNSCLLPVGTYLHVVDVLSGMVMGVYRRQGHDKGAREDYC